jgi:hypothetical protein
MRRAFRYSADVNGALSGNAKHNHAERFALCIYGADAIYSFIPKNACSTLRLSIAVANGCISGPEQVDWIHANNQTFGATLRDLVCARYTFVVLRCPFTRLVSAYLDKIVERRPQAWKYLELSSGRVAIEQLTFREFCQGMRQPRVLNGDGHWRPQVQFLVYASYDDYFAVERFGEAVATLRERIGLDVIDARAHTRHGIDGYQLKEMPGAADALPLDLLDSKRAGIVPRYRSFYDDETKGIVEKVYAQDLALYAETLGRQDLLFG